MPSESARVTTAAEARFRIDAPNSRPRATMIVALDASSEEVVKRLARLSWNRASFFIASAFDRAPPPRESFSMPGWLSDLAGRAKNLVDEVAASDHVVMIAQAGCDAPAAAIIGEACLVRSVMTTGLVLAPQSTLDEALTRTLAQVRPYAMMVVVASAEDYIDDMLQALRT